MRDLDAVLARPLDDAPRLALAEVLTRARDPRGELISVQCRLAAGGIDRQTRADLTSRARRLIAEHRSEWARGIPDAKLRRGFLDEVRERASVLVPIARSLFAAEPITQLTVTGADLASLRELAASGAFDRVVRLTVYGRSLGGEGAQIIAAALLARSTPISSLNLGGSDIGEAGAVALAGALVGCRALVLTSNELGDAGLAALASARGLSALETLFLADNELSDEGLSALAKAASLGGLWRLGVARNDEVSEDGLRAIARSKKLRRLRWLEYTDADEGCQRVLVRR